LRGKGSPGAETHVARLEWQGSQVGVKVHQDSKRKGDIMKRILCIAVLMGLTTALHAVTYTWNSTDEVFKDSNGNTLGAYKDITSLIITVNCTRSTDTITRTFFNLVQKNGESASTNLLTFGVTQHAGSYKAQITVTENSAVLGGGHWSTARAGDGKTFQAVFTFDTRDNQGVFQKLLANYAFTSQGGNESDLWSTGRNADFNGKSFDSLTASDGTEINSATIQIEGTPVPEPGLLALLALGGAGLVLRRKVRA